MMHFYVVSTNGEPNTHVIYDARKLNPGFIHGEGVLVSEIRIEDYIPSEHIHGLMKIPDVQFLFLGLMDAAYRQGFQDRKAETRHLLHLAEN